MNKKQKIIMWVGISIFVLMGLFPPNSSSRFGDVSYDFLLSTDPPDLALAHLTIQWIIVFVLTAGAIYSIKGSKNVSSEKDT